MRKVYTNENGFIVDHAKNILQANAIAVTLKNEYASGVVGEVASHDSWVELWVLNDADYKPACDILNNTFSHVDEAPWQCNQCYEENDAAFELCWNCQSNKP